MAPDEALFSSAIDRHVEMVPWPCSTPTAPECFYEGRINPPPPPPSSFPLPLHTPLPPVPAGPLSSPHTLCTCNHAGTHLNQVYYVVCDNFMMFRNVFTGLGAVESPTNGPEKQHLVSRSPRPSLPLQGPWTASDASEARSSSTCLTESHLNPPPQSHLNQRCRFPFRNPTAATVELLPRR